MNSNLIKCPAYSLSKKERQKHLIKSISEWVHIPEFTELVRLFGGEDVDCFKNKSDREYIEWLHDFVKVWDYRKKQAGGGERWNVYDDEFVSRHESDIFRAAEIMGLVNVTVPYREPDFILPLGGARMTNLERPKMARYIMDMEQWQGKTVVALAGNRPINEIEYPYLETYAPGAVTEFEAINKGMEAAFDLSPVYSERVTDNDNINLKSCIREYKDMYNGSKIYSVAAPSSEPDKRRANSYDTFVYFLQSFNVRKGDRLLLVTSSIYVTFQLLKFMELAFEYGFEVDCIGADTVSHGAAMSKASNYLQEMKSTVDASYTLLKSFGLK